MNYIFLDEVEVVPQFARVVNALNSLSNTDIYITSSNKPFWRKKIFNKWFLILSSRFPCSFREYIKRNQQKLIPNRYINI